MNELELIATAIVLDRTAGPAIQAGATAFTSRVRSRLESLRSRLGDRLPEIDFDDRVALKVLQEAATTDDDVIQAYLAGLLLVSADEAKADEAVYVLGVLAQMSRIQVRSHFAIYSAFAALLKDYEHNLDDHTKARQLVLYSDAGDLAESLGLEPTDQNIDIMFRALVGLTRLDLLDPLFVMTDAETLREEGVATTDDYGFIVTFASLGATLYLWGCGADAVGANWLPLAGELRPAFLDEPPRRLARARLVERPS